MHRPWVQVPHGETNKKIISLRRKPRASEVAQQVKALAKKPEDSPEFDF